MKEIALSITGSGTAVAHRQSGATLLEVLISVLILGIGLLGIAAMQATALRNTQGSLERSQAVIHTYAILDAMRANRARAVGGEYNLAAMTCAAPASPTGIVANDQSRWILALQAELGSSACGQIACDTASAGDCTVTVQWDESRASDTGDGVVQAGLSNRSMITRTRI